MKQYEQFISISIILAVFVLVAIKGNRKFKKPILWFGFLPIFSVSHAYLGWHIMALGFANLDTQNQLPLYAKILSPSYIGVALFGLPLEATGIGDTIAYTVAFGLNSIFLGAIIILIIRWVKYKKRA